MLPLFCTLFACITLFACTGTTPQHNVQTKLDSIVANTPAHIAVKAIVLDSMGTTLAEYAVHERDTMVSMSVIKLPMVCAMLEGVSQGRFLMSQPVLVSAEDAVRSTHSPLRDSAGNGPFTTTLGRAMSAAVCLSDNIGIDVALDATGGLSAAQSFFRNHGLDGIGAGTTYRDMGQKGATANWMTARSMTDMLYRLHRAELFPAAERNWVLRELSTTPTGKRRIRGLLPDSVVVAHKTGSHYESDTSSTARAVNDAGIISHPTGKFILITVLVNDSKLTPLQTEDVIARIARTIYDSIP
ncbi:MAG TPA: hypothetical protein DIS79_02325 [Bacteroidetes bacterium]|nr:hypothetical protein [Bacteroidota bacterium]